jgi:hypothetical protein
MNRWKKVFDNHPIHQTLKWLNDSISTDFDDIDEDEISEIRRFIKVIKKIDDSLSCMDPELAPIAHLDSLNTQLRHQNLASQITAYGKNGNISHLVIASNTLTTYFSSVSTILSFCEGEQTSDPLRNLEELIDKTSNVMIEKKDGFSNEIDRISELSKKQEESLDRLSKEVEQKKSEINILSSEWQGQFSSSQDSRSQDFSKWRDDFTSERSSEIKAIINTYSDDFESKKSNLAKKLDEIISDGTEKHKSILDLYELTAGDSVGAGYIKSASDEKEQADNWRLISVAFIILTVLWLFFSSINNNHSALNEEHDAIVSIQTSEVSTGDNKATSKPDLNASSDPVVINGSVETFPWYSLIVTFSLSGVLLWGSAYAAQQSTKHRNNEKKSRWFALEIKAFDPFISSLDAVQQNELKKQLAERIFGQGSTSVDEDTKVIDEHAFKMVADSIASILSKVSK